ncbi:hypothetical protein QN358_09145, partial [Subtercola sp. RTI3]|nr:hypothetical protein [Subtercola sp. RTI3]
MDSLSSWCGAAAPFGLADDVLLSRIADAEKLGRLVDGLRVRLAGEVAERSRAELGDGSLSRAQNFTTVPKLVAAVTGGAGHTANNWLKLGKSVRSGVSINGVLIPSNFPHVEQGLTDGS